MQKNILTPSVDSSFGGVPSASVHTDKVTLPNLDGIRAMACLLVVLVHMPVPGIAETISATGVGIFFVLSGFLMSYLYGLAPWNVKSVCRYGIARFARIAPIYWLVITICILISYYEPDSDFTQKILGGYQIARHYMFSGSSGVFWSIAPEIQYYVFFLLIWWAIAYRSKLSYALPLIVLLCCALLLTHALWPGLALPNKLHFFLAGSLAGLIPRVSWSNASDRTALFCLQLGAVFCLVAPPWLYPSASDFYRTTEIAFVFAMAVYLLSIPSRWTTFVFASPLARRIGQASFSIYLMHQLVFHFGTRLLGLSPNRYTPLWVVLGLAGVALPMVASRYVEVPLSRLTRRFLEETFGLSSRPRTLSTKPVLAPTLKN
jgi:peptidoglycan/LPS O-acetylase OafA/YrhL